MSQTLFLQFSVIGSLTDQSVVLNGDSGLFDWANSASYVTYAKVSHQVTTSESSKPQVHGKSRHIVTCTNCSTLVS